MDTATRILALLPFETWPLTSNSITLVFPFVLAQIPQAAAERSLCARCKIHFLFSQVSWAGTAALTQPTTLTK